MREGDESVAKTSRASRCKLLGTVGEPINPEAWRWYHDVVGEGRCPIVDTWWQTETGGAHDRAAARRDRRSSPASRPSRCPASIRRSSMPRARCSTARPRAISCIARSWPGQMRTVWGDHERFFQTYFTTYPGNYFTGDGCRRDEDGYYWITGRVDDVINVSGHRMGTAEVESALVLHPKVAEAAVVGMPHDIKGQGIYAYVTLNAGEARERRRCARSCVQWVRKRDRPDRHARRDPVRARPAQDPLGQDHAPHPAQDRRGRHRRARRHLHARRPGGGRRSGREPGGLMLATAIVVAVVSGALLVGAAWGIYGRLTPGVEGFLIAVAGGALILSLVSELIEPAAKQVSLHIAMGGVAAGAIVFAVLDWLVDEYWGANSGGGLLVAITLDGVPENLALGVALIGATPLAVVALAGSIFLSNLPEAAGGAKEMAAAGRSKGAVLALWAGTAALLSAAAIAGEPAAARCRARGARGDPVLRCRRGRRESGNRSVPKGVPRGSSPRRRRHRGRAGAGVRAR